MTSAAVLVTIAVAIPWPVPIPVLITLSVSLLALFVSLLTLTISFLFSFFPLFFSFPPPLVALFLSFQLGLFTFPFLTLLLFLDNALLLGLDCLLFGAQFRSYALAFVTSGLGCCGVVLISLCAVHSLLFSSLFSDVGAPNVAYALLDGARVYELTDDSLSLLVEARSLEGAIE